jgi:hypothetical protein
MNIPQHLQKRIEAIFKNPKVHQVWYYPQGFVPNSYRWPAPGTRCVIHRNGTVTLSRYDRKRSYGRGAILSPKSKKGGYIKPTIPQ